MSTAQHSPEHQQPTDRQAYDCSRDGCTNDRYAETSIKGSYCSRDCYDRSCGDRLLRLLQHDHRFCFTCFRQVKETNRLPDETRRRLGQITADAVTALQSRTEHGRIGEVHHERGPGLPDDTRRGTICECGQTGHQDREDIIREADIKAVVQNLLASLATLAEEEQHEATFDAGVLVGTLKQQARQGNDWDFPLAVGRAIVNEEADADA